MSAIALSTNTGNRPARRLDPDAETSRRYCIRDGDRENVRSMPTAGSITNAASGGPAHRAGGVGDVSRRRRGGQ
jgi:hypothetical protein